MNWQAVTFAVIANRTTDSRRHLTLDDQVDDDVLTRALTVDQVKLVLEGILPLQQVTMLSYEAGPGHPVAVRILETPTVTGLSIGEILEAVQLQFLSVLFQLVDVSVAFSSTPRITIMMVNAPPPLILIASPSLPNRALLDHSSSSLTSSTSSDGMSGAIVGTSIGAALCFVGILVALLWIKHHRQRPQGANQIVGKGSTYRTAIIEAIPPPAVSSTLPSYRDSIRLSSAQSRSAGLDLLSLGGNELSPKTVSMEIDSHLGRQRSSKSELERYQEPKLKLGSNCELSDESDTEDLMESSRVEDELNDLRNTRMYAIECVASSTPYRLERHLVDRQRADDVLKQQQYDAARRSSLVNGLSPGGSRFYEPQSAENIALVREQALALTLHARRRARAKSQFDLSVEESGHLDSITSSIHASSRVGGTLLSPGKNCRNETSCYEANPDQWLVDVMSPDTITDGQASVNAASRVARARAATPSRERHTSACSPPVGKGSCAANTASRLARARRSAENDSSRDLAGIHSPSRESQVSLGTADDQVRPEASALRRPRSLAEIRRSNSLCNSSSENTDDTTRAPELDPVTNVLHMASVAGLPPPPPNPVPPGGGLSRADSLVRMQRMRADRDANLSRSNSGTLPERSTPPLRQRALDFTTMPASQSAESGEQPRCDSQLSDTSTSSSFHSPVGSGSETLPSKPSCS